jgi:small GTP-binding protein
MTEEQLGIDSRERLVIKVIVLGSANVGKSALMERYVEGTFTGKRMPTLGTNFRTKILEIHDTSVVLQIWDTAGLERFHHGTLGSAFYRGAHGAMLVYDVTNPRSIQQLAQWRDEAVSKIDADVYFPIVIIGNKLDLKLAATAAASSSSASKNNGEDGEDKDDDEGEAGSRENSNKEDDRTWVDNPGETHRSEEDDVDCKDSQQTVLQWCRDNSYGHLETSAKDDIGIAAAMQTIAALALEAYKTNPKNGVVYRRLNSSNARRLINLNEMYAPKPKGFFDGCGCAM